MFVIGVKGWFSAANQRRARDREQEDAGGQEVDVGAASPAGRDAVAQLAAEDVDAVPRRRSRLSPRSPRSSTAGTTYGHSLRGPRDVLHRSDRRRDPTSAGCVRSRSMFRLIGLAVSIGLADSLNPSTIAPALYLAAGPRPRSSVTQFTLTVFAAYLIGGAVILLGPGQALLAIVPHPGHTARYIAEVVAGVVMLVGAGVLWARRKTLARRELPAPSADGKSSALLGLTISVVELPTAFPYFAVIAAIVGSGLGLGHQLFVLALYNVCFVLPLLLMIATLEIAGDRSERILARARTLLQRNWPVLLAGLALLAGAFVTLLGITGLASGGHGTAGRLSRKFRHIVHH